MVLDRYFKPIIKPLRQSRRARNDATNCPQHEWKEKKEKAGEEASETFERSATPRKSDDRSHDHIQPITFIRHTTPIALTIESLENIFKTTR